jgi:hypothetical protein
LPKTQGATQMRGDVTLIILDPNGLRSKVQYT